MRMLLVPGWIAVSLPAQNTASAGPASLSRTVSDRLNLTDVWQVFGTADRVGTSHGHRDGNTLLVFSRPWNVSGILYGHRERDARLMEYKIVEYTEEPICGDFLKRAGK